MVDICFRFTVLKEDLDDLLNKGQYSDLFFKSIGQYLNDIFKTAGYMSYETVARTLGLRVDPYLIEKCQVIRYGGRELVIYYEPDIKSGEVEFSVGVKVSD